MHDNATLDDELAAFTDSLLAGENIPAPAELEELAQVVRQLSAVIAPAEQPGPAFRERLTQRLNREWTLQHERRTRFRYSRRLVQLAAVVAVVLGAMIVLLLDSENKSVQGTALGSTSGIVIIVAVVAVGVLAILWFYQRQNP